MCCLDQKTRFPVPSSNVNGKMWVVPGHDCFLCLVSQTSHTSFPSLTMGTTLATTMSSQRGEARLAGLWWHTIPFDTIEFNAIQYHLLQEDSTRETLWSSAFVLELHHNIPNIERHESTLSVFAKSCWNFTILCYHSSLGRVLKAFVGWIPIVHLTIWNTDNKRD